MKVAIITPYYKESYNILKRCHDSVRSQTHRNTTHIMVADGHTNSICKTWVTEHIELPHAHNDAGATPRALAAISAFSRGYDAVGFIDADNWLYSDHVEKMVEIMRSTNSDVVAAMRNIHGQDEELLYTDTWESNGDEFTDTNCLFLNGSTLQLMTRWVTEAGQSLWSDRAFWNSVKGSGLKIAKSTAPSVAYVTKWAAHYVNAKKEPAPDSVWIGKDDKGNLIHIKHKDVKGVT